MEEAISRITAEVKSSLKLTQEQEPDALRYVRRCVNRILIFCGRDDLPPPLEPIAAQMAEDMLRADLSSLSGGGDVASITRGDTSISYRDKSSAYQRTSDFLRDYENMLVPFRRIKVPKEALP